MIDTTEASPPPLAPTADAIDVRTITLETSGPIDPTFGGMLYRQTTHDGTVEGVEVDAHVALQHVIVGRERFPLADAPPPWPLAVKAGQMVTLLAKNEGSTSAVLRVALRMTGQVETKTLPTLDLTPPEKSPLDKQIDAAAAAAVGAQRAVPARATSNNLGPITMRRAATVEPMLTSTPKKLGRAMSGAFPTSEISPRGGKARISQVLEGAPEVHVAPRAGEVVVAILRAHAELLHRHLQLGFYVDSSAKSALAWRFAQVHTEGVAIVPMPNEIALLLSLADVAALEAYLGNRLHAIEGDAHARIAKELWRALEVAPDGTPDAIVSSPTPPAPPVLMAGASL